MVGTRRVRIPLVDEIVPRRGIGGVSGDNTSEEGKTKENVRQYRMKILVLAAFHHACGNDQGLIKGTTVPPSPQTVWLGFG